MEKNETGCQAAPEAPILCVNNCGFFGTPATMNMCSKCHKDMILKQEHAKLATSAIKNIMDGGNDKESARVPSLFGAPSGSAASEMAQPSCGSPTQAESNSKSKEGPTRCMTCRKRVGLTGFNCRCGHIFCSVHRYSDKHDCPFDYRATAKDAIAKANPVVKAEKLEKI
ncbi:zinc finger A20 and AN1 domain-containing stress-associated protein 8-like [Cynara cardunculus var. scolymus]|nr:zinc finger A20 and AN1 domain-containing stress-associated protein 8-like [Cynara cardunculus var. scolymus]XP_024982743.1 zinc finger A20 and AN1 domain-containing stress-associated protein 8-like [Cynara cardunculus var. scolymus]XP_024982745.1 zinc finger A20 and AN1 domain-containing stress-associated protein 8-like [Cynara cardunculus var. scolymus]